jgi:hypothetical protein
MLIDAMARGAQGVAVLACGEQRHGCRFGKGAPRARSTVLRARRVLGRLGFRPERLALAASGAELETFRTVVARLGPSAVRPFEPPAGAGLGAAMASVALLSSDPALAPRRNDAGERALAPGQTADTLLLQGCVPFAELLLDEALEERTEGDCLRLLDAAGLRAWVLGDERCCGAPLRAAGLRDRFRELAERNAARFLETGARRIVTRCPECARTITEGYAEVGVRVAAEVLPLPGALAAAGARVRLPGALRVAGCPSAAPEAAAKVFPGVPVIDAPPLHEPQGWLGGAGQRRVVDALLARASRRRGGTLLATCPRCALVLRVLARRGSWRPGAVSVVGLGDVPPEGLEVRP